MIQHSVFRSSLPAVAAVLVLASSACGRKETPATDTAKPLGAPVDTAAANSSASAPAMTPVRGSITAISDSSLTVTTASGPQQIHVVAPLKVYSRVASDIAHVTPNAFVGITSVAQPDGSQRATEIHIFPEEMRGTGEGSRLMEQTGGSSAPSTMTNGAVAAPSRMTNGAVNATGGGTRFTVQYAGGSQTIDIPAGVSVTMIAPSTTKLTTGTNVVVLTTPGADGKPITSTVMLSAPAPVK